MIDLYKIYGYEFESTDVGDIVAVIDKDLDLKLQARIIEYEEDLDYPENDEIMLGNFLPRFTGLDEFQVINDLTREVREIGNKNYLTGGVRSNRPIWIDTEFEFAKDAIRTGKGTVILSENDGILIVDDPVNPQKALKLQAGQIALANSRDIATDTFNWRNFGTGEGWLADLVETGFIRFDRSQGGTLTLGGEPLGTDEAGNTVYQNGVLVVRNSIGEAIATLSGDYGGFGTLRIDELHDTQNVIFRTYDNSPNRVGYWMEYWVDPYDGNDSNDGTHLYPLKTIQEALNRLPKYLDRSR